MSLRGRPSRELGKGFFLFAFAYLCFAAVVAMLAQVGLPDSAAAVLIVAVTLLAFVSLGFVARTMQLPEFQTASRLVPPAFNGMATAAAFLSSAGFLGLAGAFFAGNGSELAVVAGWTIGFLLLSVLIAPYVRKAAAVTAADFLAIRFDSAAVRFAAVIVTVACSFAFLVAEIAAAGIVGAGLFGLSTETAIGIALAVILAGTLAGGMRAVTLTAVAQYIVLAIAFLTPAIVISFQEYDIPFPQLTYGLALDEMIGLGATVAPATPNRYLPVPPLDGFNMAVLAISLAAGVASMPHIVARSATATDVGAARRSAGWALFFVFIIIATAPAYAAFARLQLFVDPSLGTVEGDMVVLSLPAIAALSPAMTALVAAGALAAMLSAATALLFAIANTLGHDFFGGLIDPHGPPGRRLIMTRIALIAVAALVGWYAVDAPQDIFALAATSLSLAASGLFPVLLLGVWWKRANAAGAFAGIVLGFAAGAAYVWATLFGGMAPWQPLGSAGSGLPAMAAAFFGLPVGIIATIFVSQITREPTEEEAETLAAIRRPTPDGRFEE
jgi:cation/acetate symporter